MFRTPALAAVAAAAAAIALSACSGGEGSGGYYSTAPNGGAPVGRAPEQLAPPPGTILSANSTAQLGTVVIDGSGYTLYRFDEDSAKPPTATCADDCATTWPPVLATEPLTVEGLSEKAIGTVTRADGKEQVTIGGWPVYRYAADPAPGETTGHGKGGTWNAVTPEGTKAAAP